MTEYSLDVSDRAVCHMIYRITGLWLCTCHAYGNILSASFVRKGQGGLVFRFNAAKSVYNSLSKTQNQIKSNSSNSSMDMLTDKTAGRDDDVN